MSSAENNMAAESHDEFYIDASHINNDVLEVSGASVVSERFKIYCQNWGFSQNGVIAAADDTAGDACAVSATTTTTSHESTTSSSSDCRCDDDDDNCPHSKHYCTQTQDIVTSSCHTDVSDDSISYFFDPPPHPRVSELREENRLENEVVRRVSDAERETSQHYMKLMLAEAAAAATAVGDETTGGDDDDVMMCSDGDVFDDTNVGESVAPAAEHSRAAVSSHRLADVLEHPFRSLEHSSRSLEHPFRSLERMQCSQSFKSLNSASQEYVTANADVKQPLSATDVSNAYDVDDTLHDVDTLSDCDVSSLDVVIGDGSPPPLRVCQLRLGGRSTSFDSEDSSVAADVISLSDSCCGSNERLNAGVN